MANKVPKERQDKWEEIILNRAFGMSNTRNAAKLDVSRGVVDRVIAAFDAVKDEDWGKCCNMIVTYDMGLEFFNWAAEKVGKTIPPVIPKAYDDWKEKKRQKNLEDLKAKEAKEAADKEPPQVTKPDNSLLLRLLQEQRKTNELLESLIDVCLPKYAADLKDNINVNSDVLSKPIREINEKVEAIKNNTRKRGL